MKQLLTVDIFLNQEIIKCAYFEKNECYPHQHIKFQYSNEEYYLPS